MAALRFCEVCKAEIDAERAENAPDTRLCGAHAREIEEFGGEFVTIATQERTSKPGSLKRNYGGVSTTRRRNLEAIEKLKDAYANR
jgi:hypothetical protein